MVFEDDVQWQRDYCTCMHVLRYGTGQNVRYRSWGTEHLLVRCVRKNMPFVRTIFILLARESQKKPWMDMDGVRVVYHKEFIPERFLPTFNSATIEMFLHRIPGLSECFVYGNDDMFPLSPLKEEDFFRDGLPCQHYNEKPFPAKPNIFHHACQSGLNFVAGEFGKNYVSTWLHGGHSMSPILKSTCEHLWGRGARTIEGSISPTRQSWNFYQYIYTNYQHLSGRYADHTPEYTYVSTKNSVAEVRKAIVQSRGIVCINDNECVSDVSEYASVVREGINARLMNGQKNDYMIWVTYHRDELIASHSLYEDEHHTLFATHKEVDRKNINHMNPVYSEMVTMWYVWKNSRKSDYVGFEHYRRHLNIHAMPKKGECQVFRALDFRKQTVYEQYAQCHNAKDMDLMLSLLENRHGADNGYVRHIRNSHVLIANCCFLMRWADFKKMCEYLFPLLEDFASACGISNTNVEEWRRKAEKDFGGYRTDYQARVLSFLAERLISAWIATHMKWWNGINVAVVHYNTPELTSAAIRSLNRFTPGCRVTVFDNSDERPFENTFENVSVIDNTNGQVIDFDEMLSHYPDKEEDDVAKSNYGSAKHCRSVDYLMDVLPDGFVLMDSDVLVRKDVRGLVDYRRAVTGMTNTKNGVTLFHPMLCWMNVPMLEASGIRYFNGDKMWALSHLFPNNRYDTGAWLYEEVKAKGLPCIETDIWSYIIHFGHGSWRKKDYAQWLENNKSLFE